MVFSIKNNVSFICFRCCLTLNKFLNKGQNISEINLSIWVTHLKYYSPNKDISSCP